jgi:hypothetical protein
MCKLYPKAWGEERPSPCVLDGSQPSGSALWPAQSFRISTGGVRGHVEGTWAGPSPRHASPLQPLDPGGVSLVGPEVQALAATAVAASVAAPPPPVAADAPLARMPASAVAMVVPVGITHALLARTPSSAPGCYALPFPSDAAPAGGQCELKAAAEAALQAVSAGAQARGQRHRPEAQARAPPAIHRCHAAC